MHEISSDPQKLQRSKAWYGKGTWRRGSKATPVTQVAKESILAATDKASEVITTARSTALHGAAKRTESPSVSLSRSLRGPERSSPVIASTTKVDVTANSPINPLDGFQQSATSSAIPAQYEDPTSKQSDPNEMRTRNSGAKPDPPNDTTLAKLEGQEEKTSNETLHWRAWFSRTGELAKPEPPKASDTTDESSPHKCENTIYRRVSDPNMTISDANRHTLSLSWLGLWAATRSAKTGLADGAAVAAAPNLSIPSSSSQLPMPNAELASEAQSIQATSTDKSPGWAFWSRGTPGKPVGDAGQFEPGELVLAKPRGGVGPEYSVSNGTERASGKRPCSAEPIRRDQTSQPAQAQIQSKPLANPTKKQKTAFESEPLQANNTTSFRNLLLPPIRGTYPLAPRLSLLESLSRWWQDDRSSKTNHVQLLQNPPKIKKAIAIVRTVCFGVHDHERSLGA